MKIGDTVKILSTVYEGLHEVGSEQIITGYIDNVPYGVFINNWPYSEAEVELVNEGE